MRWQTRSLYATRASRLDEEYMAESTKRRGGRPKGDDLSRFAVEVARRTTSVHAFGEVAPALAKLLPHRGDVTRHPGLRDALEAAWDRARPGDVVLLSPGFASFDQYPNFAARARDALGWWESLGRPPGGVSLGSRET